jgi:hypothetical protein
MYAVHCLYIAITRKKGWATFPKRMILRYSTAGFHQLSIRYTREAYQTWDRLAVDTCIFKIDANWPLSSSEPHRRLLGIPGTQSPQRCSLSGYWITESRRSTWWNLLKCWIVLLRASGLMLPSSRQIWKPMSQGQRKAREVESAYREPGSLQPERNQIQEVYKLRKHNWFDRSILAPECVKLLDERLDFGGGTPSVHIESAQNTLTCPSGRFFVLFKCWTF